MQPLLHRRNGSYSAVDDAPNILDNVDEGVGDRCSFGKNPPGIHSKPSLQYTKDRRCHYGEPA